MTWTTQRPTEEGWYWYKQASQDGIAIMLVMMPFSDDRFYGQRIRVNGLVGLGSLDDWDGQWFGPLEVPE